MKFRRDPFLYAFLVVVVVGMACNLPASFLDAGSEDRRGVEDRIKATFQARTQQAGFPSQNSNDSGEATSTPYTGNASKKKLSSGETAQGIDGVTVAAADQALDNPVDVTVTRVKDPDSGGALSPERVGNYYQISASRAVTVEDGSPLFLAFPIPEGEEIDNLAVAMRSKKGELHVEPRGEFESKPSLQDTWMYRSASIDQEDRLVVITFFHIPENGRLFTVVQDSSFTPSLSSHRQMAGLARRVQETKGPFFKTVCYPGGFDQVNWSCTREDQQKAAELLEDAYHHFVDLGFKKPHIYHNYRVVSSLPEDVPNTDTGARQYVISLISCPALGNISPQAVGLYRGADGPLDVIICYDGSQVKWRGGKATDASNVRNTITHEVFHGVQLAYSGYREKHVGWFTEGTATAAVHSNSSMKRANISPYSVDLTHENENQIYRAQDFWIYTGNQLDRGLDYLIPFLKQGADIKSIDEVIQDEYGDVFPGGLSEVYWGWIKHHVFEGERNKQCAFKPATIHRPEKEHNLLTSRIQDPQSASVPPLQSKVARYNIFRMSESPRVKYQYTVRAEPKSENARSKIYFQVSAGTDRCLNTEDRSRVGAVEVPRNVEYTDVFALLGNPSLDQEAAFRLNLTPHKYEISINTPGDNTTLTQGNSRQFEAVFKKDGAPQGGASIKWTKGAPLKNGATVIEQGSSVNLSADQIGKQGTYDIYANHVGNPPREPIYDSVTVSVQSLEAPDVEITHPADGEEVYATPVGGSYEYGEGNTVIFTARGEARDAKGNAIAGNDLIWYWRCKGCSAWNESGRGTSQRFQLKDERCAQTDYQIRLVAWDNYGNKAQHIIDILVNVTGC